MSHKNKVEATISAIGYKNKSGSGAGGVCDSKSIVTIYDQSNQAVAEASAALIVRSVNLNEAYEELARCVSAYDNGQMLPKPIEVALKNLTDLKSKLGYK